MTLESKERIMRILRQLYTGRMPKLLIFPKGLKEPISLEGTIDKSDGACVLKDATGNIIGQFSGDVCWWVDPSVPSAAAKELADLPSEILELMARATEGDLTLEQLAAIKAILDGDMAIQQST